MSAWNPDPVLVEKAAKAIAETHRNLIEWDLLMASSKEHYRVLARAALSVACPGGVEPETVTRLWEHKQSGLLTRHDPQWRNGADQWSEPCEFVPLSALRLVEEELRQAREERDNWKERAGANDQDREDESQLRAEAEANWQRESALLRRAEADRDRLTRELRQAREVAHSRLRDRARLVRRAERAQADLDLLIRRFALVSARSGMRAQALQLAEDCITENVANGEGVDSQPAVLDAIFDALKYEIADEPDDARPGAEPPIQSTVVSPVQGEHEQDGEDAGGPSLDEVYAERNKVVLAFAALVKEQGWDVGLTVDPSSPDWPVLMIETDAGQVSWHFQAGELPPGLPLFAGKWDGHSTPEKYARLAELVRSAFGLSREIAQGGDTEETT